MISVQVEILTQQNLQREKTDLIFHYCRVFLGERQSPVKNPFNYAEIRADTVDSVTNYTQEYDLKELQRKASGESLW